MASKKGDLKGLKLMADKLRVHSIRATTAAGSGHPTSCMSCAEIMSALFFSVMKRNDEFILSKGHAAPILWAAYAEAGIIPGKDLMRLRKLDSVLEGHPTPRMRMVKIATGSLGQGLSAGLGMALAKRLKGDKGNVYVLLGDGECAEGSVWEAANIASYYNTGGLCAIVDANRLGQSQQTLEGRCLKEYKSRLESFGWKAVIINGHDMREILKAMEAAGRSRKPCAIIARTVKGKGIPFAEDRNGWHGRPLSNEEMEKAVSEIGEPSTTLKSAVRYNRPSRRKGSFQPTRYRKGEMIATRSAFGNALVRLGAKNRDIVVLDGDVRNSTRTEAFFRAFPERSFESFIAEQNMTGMAMGLSAGGFRPFAATFGAFLTRAYDFIRMARYSEADIKLVGSHAGVSIGEDGPSQMGLEDINMLMGIPDSVILYPCDAVSAENCVKEMAGHKGISYLRTTREKTPVVYRNNEKFPIGKLKVLRKSKQDRALIIAAGITVHEALKAHEKLKKEGISARVIDLYSVKPADTTQLLMNARECGNNVVVVEDHYYGGIGTIVGSIVERIRHLYIRDIPRSGKPEELRRKHGIDSRAIAKEIRKMV